MYRTRFGASNANPGRRSECRQTAPIDLWYVVQLCSALRNMVEDKREIASVQREITPAPSMSAKREVTLTGGTVLRVEVVGPPDAVELCDDALGAASAAIVTRSPLKDPPRIHGIVGDHQGIKDLFRFVDRVARTDATVLITGENGTGKELVARAVHAASKRANKHFVAVNCGAFTDTLLESELFGHTRGSFTGAVGDKPGLFEHANHGTFFMDEVGEMTPAMQAKLLRVLQEGTFIPIGSTNTRKVDVRVVAATNRELLGMVKAGTFREDLYYRLHVLAVHVPPLRDRASDIPLLVQAFLTRLADRHGKRKSISEKLLLEFTKRPWRGNVRELENEIERMWILSGDAGLIDFGVG